MGDAAYQFVSADLPAMLSATLAALACGVLGNFLVLRRVSLMGDAISHAVLPGLVVAFLVTSSRAPGPMLLGAAAAGIVTVVLVEALKRLGRVDAGAAMGVVFSVLFALGVVLIERAARQVDLDADCVLHGELQNIFWSPPREWAALLSWATLAELPRQLVVLGVAAGLAIGLVALFFKELRIATFDPGLATSLGFRAGLVNSALMVLVAGAAVASFEAVGSILVVAMLICPAATARLLTDRLWTQVVVSGVVAVVCGVAGYLLAAFGPMWVGWEHSVSASGMVTVVSGVMVGSAAIASPRYGVAARAARRLAGRARVAREDVLGILWRLEEGGHGAAMRAREARRTVGGGLVARLGMIAGRVRGELSASRGMVALTPLGRTRARSVVRSHRLWETYLVKRLGLRADHVHETATRLEHLRRGDEGRIAPTMAPESDPHDRPIPRGDGNGGAA